MDGADQTHQNSAQMNSGNDEAAKSSASAPKAAAPKKPEMKAGEEVAQCPNIRISLVFLSLPNKTLFFLSRQWCKLKHLPFVSLLAKIIDSEQKLGASSSPPKKPPQLIKIDTDGLRPTKRTVQNHDNDDSPPPNKEVEKEDAAKAGQAPEQVQVPPPSVAPAADQPTDNQPTDNQQQEEEEQQQQQQQQNKQQQEGKIKEAEGQGKEAAEAAQAAASLAPESKSAAAAATTTTTTTTPETTTIANEETKEGEKEVAEEEVPVMAAPRLNRLVSENMESVEAAQEAARKKEQEEKKKREDAMKRAEERKKLMEQKRVFYNKLVEMKKDMEKLTSKEKRDTYLTEMELNIQDILDAKAACTDPENFRIKLEKFPKEMQNQYGLHKFAVEKAMLMDYLEEKKTLDTIDKKTEFLKKCIQKYVEYDRMPPQAKSLKLFNASLEERKWYLWGSLGWKEYMQQRQMDIMKLRQEQQRSGIKRIPFQIPPGWTHELLPVKTTPENPAKREFILLKIPNGLKPGTPYIYPFQRRLVNLVFVCAYPPHGVKKRQEMEQSKKAGAQQSFSGLKSGFLNKVGDNRAAAAAGKSSSKKISKKSSSSSSRLSARQVVPGQWTWGAKDAFVLGGAAVFIGGLSYLFWRKNRKNNYYD
eukprot:jgi/Bigna1/136422/aug1.34_g11130